ncbi:MAG: DeoR/GlpR family DNA-binding transcription regulator [Spirochaeta sp.]|jgi:DeoR family galactitol utilization operon repressor|nr:DeoR/GlpR family DNA-binding transcription regulator [Spirochaeta sp.]
MTPNVTERERGILSILADDPSVGVGALAERLEVSQVSVRSYLNALEEKGYLIRVHGGAVTTYHPHVLERQNAHAERKRAIAKAAAEQVEDGDTIMIEAGTTTALVARYLLGKRDVMVVTNNTLALSYLRGNPGVRVTVIGGEYRPATESLVGPLAVEDLKRFHVRRAFVGTDGFTVDAGFTTHLVEGAEIVRCMVSQARETIAVADSSKYGRLGFVHVLPLRDVDTLLTDSDIPASAIEELTEHGVKVRQVLIPGKET